MADKTMNLITQLSLNDDAFKNSLKNVKANVKDLMNGVDGTTANINEMRKALGALQNVSFKGKSIEEMNAVNERVKALKTSITELSEKQSNIKPIEIKSEALTKYMGMVTGVGGAVLGVGSAFEGFKKVMDSTETTSAKFELGMAKVKGGVDAFFRTIATGDWSNFLTNMKKAIQAATEYEEAMKLIHHETRGNEILNADAEKEISQIRIDLMAAKAEGAAGKAKYDALLARALELRKQEMSRNLLLATEDYEAKRDEAMKKLFSEEDLLRVVRFTAESKKNYEAVLQYQELTKKINDENSKKTYSKFAKPVGDKTNSNISVEVQKLQQEQQKIINEHPLKLNMKVVLDHTTMTELDSVGAAITKQSNVVTENNQKNLRILKGGIAEELMAEKADAKALAEKKTAYEEINDKVKKQQELIQNVISQGGTVTPAMNDKLAEYIKKLDNVNRDYNEQIRLAGITSGTGLKAIKSADAKPVVQTTETKPPDLANIDLSIAATNDKITKFSQKTKKEMTETQKAVNSAIVGVIGGFTNSMVDSFKLADNGIQGFAKNILKTMLNLVTQIIAASLSQSEAIAISNAEKSASATGPAAVFTTPAFIATAVGGVLAAFAAIPKFAMGGIVPGSNYSGDNIPVMANSGEMMLNHGQQANLFSMINKGQSNGIGHQVEFKITGTSLTGVLNNHNKKISNTR